MRLNFLMMTAGTACVLAWPTAAIADTWYYVNFSPEAKQVDQQCIRLPADTTPQASLAKYPGGSVIVSDKTAADQSRVLVLSTGSRTRYAFASTVKACRVFRAPILAEAARRKSLDTQNWYVAQLTHGNCIPMREMFGGVATPEALHRQMTKDGTHISLERSGDGVRLLSFDGRDVPPLHLVNGQAACEDYVRR